MIRKHTVALSVSALLAATPTPSLRAQEATDLPGRPPMNEATLDLGRSVYRQTCIYCHGKSGEGDGPVVFFLSRDIAPRPRDFTKGAFKYRSTASGTLPTDEDLFRIITRGRAGFMPSYRALGRDIRWALVYYLKSLVPDFQDLESPPESIEIGDPFLPTPQSIRQGEGLYRRMQCWKCHGEDGEGKGPSGDLLKTSSGLTILAADLTRPSSFGNGHDAQDVYRTLMTGLTGVPMPSYASVLTNEDAWHLANFILSLSREGE